MREGHCKEIPGLAATVSKTTTKLQPTPAGPKGQARWRAVRCPSLSLHLRFRGIPYAQMIVRPPIPGQSMYSSRIDYNGLPATGQTSLQM